MEKSIETEENPKDFVVNKMSLINEESDVESEEDNIIVFKNKSFFFRASRNNKFHLDSDDEEILRAPLTSSMNGVQTDDESRDSVIVSKTKVGKIKRVIKVLDNDSSAEEDNRNSDLDESTVKSDRIESKRNKMVEKFKNRFINKKKFFIETLDNSSEQNSSNKSKNNIRKINSSDTNSSDDEEFSNTSRLKENNFRESIVPKTVFRSNMDNIEPNSLDSHSCNDDYNLKSTISLQQQKFNDLCDEESESSDISDEDFDNEHQSKSNVAVLKEHNEKPKEKRMSAKLAMENMHKIKSESNRMLREKEVSLPYHRPRQISLKDILNRRKPITGLDGKKLPIKMNAEQLKQYAQQLEERQKEIIELCKSESEESSDEDNKVALPFDFQKEMENINAVESIKLVKNCIQDKIETLVEFSGLTDDAKTEDNTHIKLNTIHSETQIEVPEDVLEHLAVHETNTSVDSQAMELSYSENTETFCKDSDEFCNPSEKDIFIQKNKNLVSPKDHNCKYTIGPTMEMHHHNTGNHQEKIDFTNNEDCTETKDLTTEEIACDDDNEIDNNCSDNDIDMSQIEDIIDKMEEEGNKEISQTSDLKLIKVVPTLNPKLSGTPGSVIDLDFDSAGQTPPRKLTGVDLLKEKFVYFSQLKTPEEKEREKEKVIKPGQQHLKLKQELEEQMAEQRSLEWAKRIEEDKIRQQETKQMNGELSDCEDILEKDYFDKEDGASESDRDESDDELTDQEKVENEPRETNPLVEDKAEEDDDEENEDYNEEEVQENNNENEGSEGDDEEDSSSEETVSEEDDKAEDQPKKQKRSRILKAFEDSDDDEKVFAKEKEEESILKNHKTLPDVQTVRDVLDIEIKKTIERVDTDDIFSSQESQSDKAYDCDDMPLAQQNSLFTQASQEEAADISDVRTNTISSEPKIIPITNTQQNTQTDLVDIVGMCSGSFPSTHCQLVSPTVSLMAGSLSQLMQSCDQRESQDIGEDVLAMCTGQFAEGVISPISTNTANKANDADIDYDATQSTQQKLRSLPIGSNLNASLRDLLDIDDLDTDKGMNFFSSNLHDKPKSNKGNYGNIENIQGKLMIVSSDEEAVKIYPEGKRKVLKKRMYREKKRKQLQISDDEDSIMIAEDDLLASSDETIDRLVEYDSEENEVELNVGDMPKKKKRHGIDFLDQEAELSSEDEWKGSGDEDEAGLDQLEREDGDDDHYNQKKLRSELEKIHMRQLLDQDKREVRLLQELLLEDGELAGGHRQRKFRWKNSDLESEQQGTVPDDEHGDKQDEVESEEQWRKQRHEREVFLRQLMEQKTDESVLDVSFNRTSIIKANLESKSMSSLLLEVKSANSNTAEVMAAEENKILANNAAEKKISLKELPSPVKKPFLMQKQFRGSFLSRGQSSLDRLAALARPLSGEDERPGQMHTNNQRSFVFSAVSPPCPNAQLQEKTKMAKRKADAEMSTPTLIKKFRVNDKKGFSKKSLLDQIDK